MVISTHKIGKWAIHELFSYLPITYRNCSYRILFVNHSNFAFIQKLEVGRDSWEPILNEWNYSRGKNRLEVQEYLVGEWIRNEIR